VSVGFDGEDAILIIDAALVIVLGSPVALLAFKRKGEGGGRLLLERKDRVGDVGLTVGGDDVSGSARVSGIARGSDGEGTTVDEGAADREDDAEGHCGREDGSHASNDSSDGILWSSGSDDEPEEHVSHVDKPDGAVEVKAVTEHELPVSHGLDIERAEGATESESEGCGVENGGGKPVEADPDMFGLGNATLTFFQGGDLVETTHDGGDDDLNGEQ